MKIDMILADTILQEGFIILIVGLVTVFCALISLFVVFHYLVPASLRMMERSQKKKRETGAQKEDYVSGEQIAAAVTSVHMLLNEIHDDENAILTIHESVKEYSPWSSKIYSTHQIGKK